MSKPAIVFLAKFRSSLPIDEVHRVAKERIDQFRALPGLLQKYYLRETETGEVAGLYFWESPEARSPNCVRQLPMPTRSTACHASRYSKCSRYYEMNKPITVDPGEHRRVPHLRDPTVA